LGKEYGTKLGVIGNMLGKPWGTWGTFWYPICKIDITKMNYNSLKLHFNKLKLKSPNQAITFFFTPTNKPIQHPLYISTLIFEP
jgi:hypothetical protein